MKIVVKLAVVCTIILTGCATTQSANRCVTYTIRGDRNIAWYPTRFLQKDNNLIIEIPSTSNYVPMLAIIDTEFDQRIKVDYTFDVATHSYIVRDNYDKYILYRDSFDGVINDKIYITCNRLSYK